MTPPSYDDPESIQREEARQELIGRGGKGGHGTEAYTVIGVVVALVAVAIAIESIDSWAQWVVLGAICLTVIGFMIALSPNRRGY
jgi:hypothetical protein